jgi:hypothetical protein
VHHKAIYASVAQIDAAKSRNAGTREGLETNDPWYYWKSMEKDSSSRPARAVLRAVIEMAFIIFLFYSNLLMGEFTAANGHGKTMSVALYDIFTVANFLIALISAGIGYVVFEYLRRKF